MHLLMGLLILQPDCQRTEITLTVLYGSLRYDYHR